MRARMRTRTYSFVGTACDLRDLLTMRRLVAAGLLALLAARFWYMWNEGTGTESTPLQQPREPPGYCHRMRVEAP